MTSLNVIHVKHDACCAQRKRVILISKILDFREKQHVVTKRLSFVSSGFNTEKEDETDPFFYSLPNHLQTAMYRQPTEFYTRLFLVSITHSITLVSYFGISSRGILLQISYWVFEINSLC